MPHGIRIVCSGDSIRLDAEGLDRTAFLAAAAQTHGWNIEAFGEFEDAFHWLIV